MPRDRGHQAFQANHRCPRLGHGVPSTSVAVLQAVTGTVSAAAAIATGLFAFGIYRLAGAQLNLQRQQTEHAKREAEAAKEQVNIARQQAASQLEAIHASSAREQEKAERFWEKKTDEEMRRPRFWQVNGFSMHTDSLHLQFKNGGPLLAMNVVARLGTSLQIIKEVRYLPEGLSMELTLAKSDLVAEGIAFDFRTKLGSEWRLLYHVDEIGRFSESVVLFKPGYGPNSV